MQISNELAKYQIVPVKFFQANVAASQTAVALKESANQCDGISMPFAGEIIAVTADLSAAGTVGTFTVTATVGGTAKTVTATAITTETAKVTKVARDSVKFNAGDVIGAKITSGATWNGTTADLVVNVYVALAVEGV